MENEHMKTCSEQKPRVTLKARWIRSGLYNNPVGRPYARFQNTISSHKVIAILINCPHLCGSNWKMDALSAYSWRRAFVVGKDFVIYQQWVTWTGQMIYANITTFSLPILQPSVYLYIRANSLYIYHTSLWTATIQIHYRASCTDNAGLPSINKVMNVGY
jgi:hypothetical protein